MACSVARTGIDQVLHAGNIAGLADESVGGAVAVENRLDIIEDLRGSVPGGIALEHVLTGAADAEVVALVVAILVRADMQHGIDLA